jgi:DNA polymerase-4
VAHLDADAVYVAVELLRHPELRGRPVVVAGSGPRAVVTTASYEARRYGVGSAMPAARARRLCPEAVFLPPDFTTYRETSAKLMAIVRSHVERVDVVGLDEAYLDVQGLLSPRAAMRRLVVEINRSLQLTCSVGIGPNKLVAKVASDADKPAGFVVLTRAQACARFALSPPGIVPGIGPKTSQRLSRLGLNTLGDLANAPEGLLTANFGPNHGHDLIRRARFEGGGEIGTPHKVASESRERTFDEDLLDAGRMRGALQRMSTELCESLARHGRSGRTIGIKVRLDNFTTVTRARTLREPTCDAQLVAQVALRLLDEYAPPRPVRLLGVRVAGLGPNARAGAGEDTEGGAARNDADEGVPSAGAAGGQLGLPV